MPIATTTELSSPEPAKHALSFGELKTGLAVCAVDVFWSGVADTVNQ
jgi:hypothetical protein